MTATTASAAHAPGAKRGATPNSAVDTPTSTSRAGTVTSAAPSMRGTSPASVVMTAYATPTPKPAAASVVQVRAATTATEAPADRKSTRLNPVTNAHLVCRLLLEKKKHIPLKA